MFKLLSAILQQIDPVKLKEAVDARLVVAVLVGDVLTVTRINALVTKIIPRAIANLHASPQARARAFCACVTLGAELAWLALCSALHSPAVCVMHASNSC